MTAAEFAKVVQSAQSEVVDEIINRPSLSDGEGDDDEEDQQ